MTYEASTLNMSSTYEGNSKVVFGNKTSLGMSGIDSYNITPNLKLFDVLLVPHLTKNLLSISGLTHDYKVNVLLSQNSFITRNRKTGTQ